MTWYSNAEGRYGANGAKGDLGEQIVDMYCEKRGIPFVSVQDRYSQTKLKIDCYIDNIPVDVKSNYYKGSLVVELFNKKKNAAGWLFTTTAKQIYGVDIATSTIFRYNINEMINYVVNNKKRAVKSKNGDVLMYVSVKEPFIEKLL